MTTREYCACVLLAFVLGYIIAELSYEIALGRSPRINRILRIIAIVAVLLDICLPLASAFAR